MSWKDKAKSLGELRRSPLSGSLGADAKTLNTKWIPIEEMERLEEDLRRAREMLQYAGSKILDLQYRVDRISSLVKSNDHKCSKLREIQRILRQADPIPLKDVKQ